MGSSILLYFTFLAGYFNGYEILITVNSCGEANFEFILIPIFLIIGCWTSLSSLKFFFDKKQRQHLNKP